MNTKENALTNINFSKPSSCEIPYKMSIKSRYAYRNSKVIPPDQRSGLIFSGVMINRETSDIVLEAFEINFNLLNVFREMLITSETKLGVN
jgi:hypothetical protein